jgi:exonuclease VII small subunit
MSPSDGDPAHALEAASAELEQAAERLRTGDLDGDAAAVLVERCAALAATLGSELDRAARAAAEPMPSGQETLL